MNRERSGRRPLRLSVKRSAAEAETDLFRGAVNVEPQGAGIACLVLRKSSGLGIDTQEGRSYCELTMLGRLDLSKPDKEKSEESAPARAWVMGIAGWLIPGMGHLLQGKWGRAVFLGGAVWACFILGFLMGGNLFQYDGSLLRLPPMIGNFGTGLLYIVPWFMGIGFLDDVQRAALPTFEFGWTFLIVAGLLNYLSMLDAFDIAAGRKS